MPLGDFVNPDPQIVPRARPIFGGGEHGEHFKNSAFISRRIAARGHTEWDGNVLLDAAALWREGKGKRQIADHFNVTLHSIVGMIFRNRALFAKRRAK